MIINLHRIWEMLNLISGNEGLLNSKKIYPDLLGKRSNYTKQDYNSFLEYYSLKCEEDYIVVFNNDCIPYIDHNVDFSYLPKELLEYNDDKLLDWINEQVDIHIKRIEQTNQEEKENITNQIKILTKRLERL